MRATKRQAPKRKHFGDNTTRIETNYAHCGGGYYGGGRGERGGYGCGGAMAADTAGETKTTTKAEMQKKTGIGEYVLLNARLFYCTMASALR